MDSTFYFYYGITQQWLLANGQKKKHAKGNDSSNESKEQVTKVKYFDELPNNHW